MIENVWKSLDMFRLHNGFFFRLRSLGLDLRIKSHVISYIYLDILYIMFINLFTSFRFCQGSASVTEFLVAGFSRSDRNSTYGLQCRISRSMLPIPIGRMPPVVSGGCALRNASGLAKQSPMSRYKVASIAGILSTTSTLSSFVSDGLRSSLHRNCSAFGCSREKHRCVRSRKSSGLL